MLKYYFTSLMLVKGKDAHKSVLTKVDKVSQCPFPSRHHLIMIIFEQSWSWGCIIGAIIGQVVEEEERKWQKVRSCQNRRNKGRNGQALIFATKTKLEEEEAASGSKVFDFKNFSLPQMHCITATSMNNV